MLNVARVGNGPTGSWPDDNQFNLYRCGPSIKEPILAHQEAISEHLLRGRHGGPPAADFKDGVY